MQNMNFRVLTIVMMVLFGMTSGTAFADRDRRDRDDDHRKYSGDHRKNSKNYHYDKRYHHDRYYPRSGISINVLPSHHYSVRHDHDHYYFSAGIWYRPSAGRYIVVRPPIGVVIPVLPPFYTTIWFAGVPYYYANDVYYVWHPDRNGYVVTEPPADSEQAPVPLSEQLFAYPKKGQSEQQQADDRYACHRWGVDQTGYDPTKPEENKTVEELNRVREDYQRAMKACLEGRGYSVQ